MTLKLTLAFADDLDLGTRRCVSMRCAFIPNMSPVTKLFRSNQKTLSFHVKFVQTDRQTTVKQYAPDLSIRRHKKFVKLIFVKLILSFSPYSTMYLSMNSENVNLEFYKKKNCKHWLSHIHPLNVILEGEY